MDDLTIKQVAERSKKIWEHYRSLEMKHHGSEWSVAEDALAGESNEADLEHKIGESMWWLMVLADRMGIDSEEALDNFLSTTEKRFDL
jgi:NTP pyrophosphatase (non-canonical NTP hydrolase)